MDRTTPAVDEMTNSWGMRLVPGPHSRYSADFSILKDVMARQVNDFRLLQLTASGSAANEMAISEATDCKTELCLFAMGSYVVGVGSMLAYSTCVSTPLNKIGLIVLPEYAHQKACKQTVALPYHIPGAAIDDQELHELERRCLDSLEKILLYAKLFSEHPYKALLMEHVLSGNGGELTDRFLAGLGTLLKTFGVVVIVDEILNGGRVGPQFCVTMTTPKEFQECVRYITFGKFMQCGMLLCHHTVFPDCTRGTTTVIDPKDSYDYVATVIDKIDKGDLPRRRQEVLDKLLKSKPMMTKENYWGRGLQMYTSYCRRMNDDNLKHRLLPMLVPGMKIRTTTMDKPTWTRTQMSRELMDAADLWLSHLDTTYSGDLQWEICRYISHELPKENLIFPNYVMEYVAKNSDAEALAENFRKRKRQERMGSCTLNLKGCIKNALKDASTRSNSALTYTRKKCARIECFEYNLSSPSMPL